MKVVDLSQAMEELYNRLDINCYDLYRIVKNKGGKWILIVYPTDAPRYEVDIEGEEEIVRKVREIIEKKGIDGLKEIAKEIYDISEYDEAYLVRIE